jgi:hypothetical protein
MSDDEYYEADPAEDSIEDFDALVKLNKSQSESEEESDERSDEKSGESDEEVEENEEIDVKSVSDFIQEIIIIKPENRRTSNMMSKFEMTNHICIRATQIAKFNNCMVDINGLTTPEMMAKRELMMRKSPLTLRRQVGKIRNKKTGKIDIFYEYWDPNVMMFATTYIEAL